MSFKIIQGDITEMSVDAIVNAANPEPLYVSGTDIAVFTKAGGKLAEERKMIGKINPGEVAITGGYDLPCRYVIHAVGTRWKDGTCGELDILRSCYRKSLQCALEKSCRSLAFPLLATGNYHFPRALSMQIALEECCQFLLNHSDIDMTIYLVVFDPESVRLAKTLVGAFPHTLDEQEYLKKAYWEYNPARAVLLGLMDGYQNPHAPGTPPKSLREILQEERGRSQENVSLKKTLQYFLEEKGLQPSQLYNAIFMSCQTFMNIYQKGLTPKKENLRKIAIGLHLDYEEAKFLFSQAGYALNSGNAADEIMIACCRNHCYDLQEIDEVLYETIGKTYFAIS